LIFDGVELPSLLTVEKAAQILGLPEEGVRSLIANRQIESVRLNGLIHIVTESIAERLQVETPSRHNQDCE